MIPTMLTSTRKWCPDCSPVWVILLLTQLTTATSFPDFGDAGTTESRVRRQIVEQYQYRPPQSSPAGPYSTGARLSSYAPDRYSRNKFQHGPSSYQGNRTGGTGYGLNGDQQDMGYYVRIPNIFSGMPLAFQQIRALMGTWYPYAFFSKFADVQKDLSNRRNAVDQYVAYGDSRLPFSNTPAIVATQIETWTNATTGRCDGFYEACFFSVNGWQAAFSGYSADGAPAGGDETLVLYTDLDSFSLFFSCFDRNLITGLCDDPYFYASTRVPRDQLSARQVDRINETLSRQVHRYGLSAACFLPRIFDSRVATCPITADPPCFEAELVQLQNLVQAQSF